MNERTKFLLIVAVFVAAYTIPFDHPTVRSAGLEAFLAGLASAVGPAAWGGCCTATTAFR